MNPSGTYIGPIEDGIAIPVPFRPSKTLMRALRAMKPAQCRFVAPIDQTGAANAARSAFGNGNYKTRAHKNGYRIWRTA